MLPEYNIGSFIDQTTDHVVLSARCPYCRTVGVLSVVTPADLRSQCDPPFVAGLRRCPNLDCEALLFFVKNQGTDRTLHLLPPEVIDFDSSNLPRPVEECLSKAVTCHANGCYRAAAVMIRRTLDEACSDRSAPGKTLQERLKAIAAISALPADLIDGLEELKLLGNDGAHVFTKHYDSADEELRLALDIVKQVLLSVYQHASLVSKLRSRRKGQTAADATP